MMRASDQDKTAPLGPCPGAEPRMSWGWRHPVGPCQRPPRAPGGRARAGGSRRVAQRQVRGKFGDWEMRCETPPGASREQCAIIQSVAAEDKPNMNLVVIVLKTADGKSRLLRVIAPLGVLLPAGLGLNIDYADKGRAGFVRCLPSGCVAEVVMDDKLLEELRSARRRHSSSSRRPSRAPASRSPLRASREGFEKLP